MKLQDFLNSKQISLYINKLPKEATLDESLFPDEKQLGLEIEQAEGSETRVKVLRVSQFDVAAKKRALSAKIDINKHEMPFFKESIGINEKQRRDIIQAQQSGNENLIKFLLSKVFDNYSALVAGAGCQMKRMRAQVIQNGAINISTDDGDIVVDYGIPSNHKEVLNGSSMWNDATADIIGDLLRWQAIFTDNGYAKPTNLIMTEKTFNNTIMKNTAIKEDMSRRFIQNTESTNLILTTKEFLNYLKTRFGISVAFVDGVFINENDESVNYYEDGKITFITPGILGKSMYSYTPEEYDKSFGSSKLDTSVVGTGTAITTMVNEDPVTVDTKVSMIGMPQLENVKGIYLATVYSE